MALVQRANVVLEVKEDAVDRMLGMGYNLIDEQGNVVQRSTIKTVESMTELYNIEVEKVAKLEKQVAKLKAEIKNLKKASKSGNDAK